MTRRHASVLASVVGAKESWPAGAHRSFSPQMLQSRIVEISRKILQQSNVASGVLNVADQKSSSRIAAISSARKYHLLFRLTDLISLSEIFPSRLHLRSVCGVIPNKSATDLAFRKTSCSWCSCSMMINLRRSSRVWYVW